MGSVCCRCRRLWYACCRSEEKGKKSEDDQAQPTNNDGGGGFVKIGQVSKGIIGAGTVHHNVQKYITNNYNRQEPSSEERREELFEEKPSPGKADATVRTETSDDTRHGFLKDVLQPRNEDSFPAGPSVQIGNIMEGAVEVNELYQYNSPMHVHHHYGREKFSEGRKEEVLEANPAEGDAPIQMSTCDHNEQDCPESIEAEKYEEEQPNNEEESTLTLFSFDDLQPHEALEAIQPHELKDSSSETSRPRGSKLTLSQAEIEKLKGFVEKFSEGKKREVLEKNPAEGDATIQMSTCDHTEQDCPESIEAEKYEEEQPNNEEESTITSFSFDDFQPHEAVEAIQPHELRDSSSETSRPGSSKLTLSQAENENLKELYKSYQQERSHQKTVETLQLVMDQVDGWEKLKPTLALVDYLIQLRRFREAMPVCVQAIFIVNLCKITSVVKQSKNSYDENLKELILKLIKRQEFDCAITLTKCRITLDKNLFEKECRFSKLENIAWLVVKISQEMSMQNKKEQIKRLYSLPQDIIDYLQTINDVSLKFRRGRVAWVLMQFGICCIEATDWAKTISLNNEAIALIETTFGEVSRFYRIVGQCQNNLGIAYRNTNQLLQAKAAYLKAIEAYNTATDWLSKDQKLLELNRTRYNLALVEERLLIS